MLVGVRMYEGGELKKITTLKRNALLSQIDNPGAILVKNQIQVINPSNETFTKTECEIIERGLNIELTGKVL